MKLPKKITGKKHVNVDGRQEAIERLPHTRHLRQLLRLRTDLRIELITPSLRLTILLFQTYLELI